MVTELLLWGGGRFLDLVIWVWGLDIAIGIANHGHVQSLGDVDGVGSAYLWVARCQKAIHRGVESATSISDSGSKTKGTSSVLSIFSTGRTINFDDSGVKTRNRHARNTDDFGTQGDRVLGRFSNRTTWRANSPNSMPD